MHDHEVLLGLASIVALGVGAQCLAWLLRLPSILLLLATGLLVGPVLCWLEPEKLMHELLFPVVSLSVAVILFEGGLSLRLSQLRQMGGALTRLLTIGALVTWVLATFAAVVVLRFELSIALILGAILVVTGPTVVGPLLRHVRPTGRVGPMARWEGIVIDPIGAILAVLVLQMHEPIQSADFTTALKGAVVGLSWTLLCGGGIGLLAGLLLVQVLKRHYLPDYLHGSAVLMVVLTAFTAANLLQAEAGLLTVTLIGVILANQQGLRIQHVVELKENLQVLLISFLFILLAARVQRADLLALDWRCGAYLIFLVVVVRPAAVLLSAWGTDLQWNERIFLCWLAPRGIVAAAVASVFALALGKAGAGLVPIVFLVIVGTALIYGLTLAPVAQRLGLASPNPQGLVILGAHAGARAIAHALKEADFHVALVDRSRANVRVGQLEGLKCYYANVLSETTTEELQLGGMGRFLALSSNDEVNSLAAMHFREIFGRAEVYQLPPEKEGSTRQTTAEHHLQGRLLFAENATFQDLDGRFAAGAMVKTTKITEEHTFENFQEHYGATALPLFLVPEPGRLIVCTADQPAAPKPGQALISLVMPVVAAER